MLSYAELGAALGITPASAKRLAIRRAWAKRPGNDGKTRVAVPIERLQVEPPVTGDATSEAAGDIAGDTTRDVTGDISAAVTVLTHHIERLERELAAASAERDAERARSAQVAVLQAVLDIERQRLSETREEAERARDEAERWRQMATTSRGLWAWLRHR